jgi:hypothetical protein
MLDSEAHLQPFVSPARLIDSGMPDRRIDSVEAAARALEPGTDRSLLLVAVEDTTCRQCYYERRKY